MLIKKEQEDKKNQVEGGGGDKFEEDIDFSEFERD